MKVIKDSSSTALRCDFCGMEKEMDSTVSEYHLVAGEGGGLVVAHSIESCNDCTKEMLGEIIKVL